MLPAEYSTYYCTSHAYTYTGHVCPERNALPISSHCSDPLVISLTHTKGFQTLSHIRTYQVVTHKMSSYRCARDNHKQVFSVEYVNGLEVWVTMGIKVRVVILSKIS